ncbi:MAG: FAD binding domain-containing protein [Actinomycetota bacterium]|jgi:carbon-monoxide dehydrogenase medium subunit|nr:FAD binding domain-containing protein [Actinomycetota bacterium]
MKLPPFEVHRPSSLHDASRLLRDMGSEAVPINGGTELLLAMKLGLAQYAHLVDLKRIPELRGVRRVGSGLAVGAGMTHRELESSRSIAEAVAEMPRMLAEIANVRVRSVGTIGGNLCFADPHSDPATFLSAIEATLVLGDGSTSRRVPVDEFFLGAYETKLEPGELLVEVTVPAVPTGTGAAHVRMKVHERPTVTVAAKVMVERDTIVRARLVVGSVCGTPVLPQAIDKLIGAPRAAWSERVREVAALSAAAVAPVADAEGSSRYKQALVEVFVRRALDAALSNAQGMTR